VSPRPTGAARASGVADRAFALLLYLLPHHLLSRLVYVITRWEWPPLKNRLIRGFIRLYDVDLSEANEASAQAYPCFNAFFTRSLKDGARPLAGEPSAVLCPADGALSQIGAIEQGRIFQAKGRWLSAVELLGGDPELAAQFDGGSFATIYLSPRDYHRVHMPLAGALTRMIHVPGRLFSVSPSTTRSVPRLFSRNERLVCLFSTAAGPMVVVMVGAIFVASMDTVWAGAVTPAGRRTRTWGYASEPPTPPTLARGAELGRFNIGSTVILLLPKGTVRWDDRLEPRSKVHMGQALGHLGK
jgi:phosphatidylserine decarboxylase